MTDDVKSEDPTSNPEKRVGRQIALVLLENAIEPDMKTLAGAIRERHPGTPVILPREDPRSALLVCGGEIVVVMAVPAPIPRDEAVINIAAPVWPDARAAFECHRAHLFVSTIKAAEHRLLTARPITAVVGGLIATVTGCLGVVWNGRVALPADRWSEMSHNAFSALPDFPFMLWVAIRPFRDGSTIGAISYGLSSFVGREIEYEGKGSDVTSILLTVGSFAAYLIDRGSLIADGDTISRSESERITVRHKTSNRFGNLPVLFATAPVT